MLICLTSTLFGQDLRPETKKLVKKIIEINELHHKHVSAAGQTTDQYYNFIGLRDNATTPELISLLEHNNSVVKGYASWALADNKNPTLEKILFKFLKSNEKVKTFQTTLLETLFVLLTGRRYLPDNTGSE